MFSEIFKHNFKYQKEKVQKVQKELNKIYEILINDKSKEKEALSLLDDLIYKKIKLSNIPQSLNLDGSFILTFSKFWMIIILTTLPQIKKLYDKVNKFIELINISLYHELNEKNEYRKFFEDKCEELFSDNNAIKAINRNNELKKKLNKKSAHFEIKNHYIYLLNKPFSFENKFSEENKISEMKETKNKENKDKNKREETIYSFNDITKEEKENVNDNNSQNENNARTEESEDEKEKKNKKENKKKKLNLKKTKKKKNKFKNNSDKKENNPTKKRKSINKSVSLSKNKNKKEKNIDLSKELSDSFLKELENIKKNQNIDKINNSNKQIENEDNTIFHSNSSKYFDIGNNINFDSNQISDLLSCSYNDIDSSTEM